MVEGSDRERQIRVFAERLAAASTPSVQQRARDRMSANAVAMAWATRRPDFKTHLFRFVDVVPACRSAADVARHLREELDRPSSPRAVRAGLALAQRTPGGDAVAAAVARTGIRQMARRFIIGADLDEVVDEIGRRWADGLASTVDLLGEKTLTDADADGYARRVSATLDALVAAARSWPARPVLEQDPFGPIGRVNLSVKPTALAPHLRAVTEARGVAEAVERLGSILDRARHAGATVHLDAEHDETKDATQALLREIGRRWPDGPALGCVIQAYRHDAAGDLAALIDWSAATLDTPLQIRLVKGAYWDAETISARAHGWDNPLFEAKTASDANYELCAEDLAVGAAQGAVRPAFASHNLRSIAAAVVRLEAGNIYVNAATTGAMVGRQPFGGHRLSGSGAKAAGPGYLQQFADAVVVTENTERQGFAPDL